MHMRRSPGLRDELGTLALLLAIMITLVATQL
jgi:hypothetical protein